MMPFLKHGESVLVVRARNRWNQLRRGDVAVFRRPTVVGGISIKRVVGLPGEDIKIVGSLVYVEGQVLVEGYISGVAEPGEKEWFNGPDEYFLLGDNRAESTDSRDYGPVTMALIEGKAWFRCWPPVRWRPVGRDKSG